MGQPTFAASFNNAIDCRERTLKMYCQLYAANADGQFTIPQYINLPNRVQVHRMEAGLDTPAALFLGTDRRLLRWNGNDRRYVPYTEITEALFHMMLMQRENRVHNNHVLEITGRMMDYADGPRLGQVFLRVYY